MSNSLDTSSCLLSLTVLISNIIRIHFGISCGNADGIFVGEKCEHFFRLNVCIGFRVSSTFGQSDGACPTHRRQWADFLVSLMAPLHRQYKTARTEFPAAFSSGIPRCDLLIILLIPKKSSMLIIAAILFCHRSFDSTTRRIPLSNEISAVSATISLLTPSEQNPRRQASVRGYLNPFSVRCSTHSV